MQRLEAFFESSPQPARRKVFVIHGLGGMVKTRVCVEFARKHKADFSAILWLEGSSKDALRQSLSNAALRLPSGPSRATLHPPQATIDLQELIDSLLRWLSLQGNTRWLLILDNSDRDWQATPKDRQAYHFEDFPTAADHGAVLVTTRLARLQRPNASTHLHSVSNDLGRDILEMRAAKPLAGRYIYICRVHG